MPTILRSSLTSLPQPSLMSQNPPVCTQNLSLFGFLHFPRVSKTLPQSSHEPVPEQTGVAILCHLSASLLFPNAINSSIREAPQISYAGRNDSPKCSESIKSSGWSTVSSCSQTPLTAASYSRGSH